MSDENEEGDEGDVEDEYDEGEGDRVEGEDEEEDDEDKGEDDKRTPSRGGGSGSQEDGGTRPFILLAIWTVNDFYPAMTDNIFKNLWDRYQIPENVPIRLPRKFK